MNMNSVQHFESNFTSNDGLILFSQAWFSDQSKKAILCLVHGIGEHSGRYVDWAEKFVKKGFVFTSFDLRGHGKSQGKRGHTPSINHYFDDINLFLDATKSKFPDLPIILYGHSMGGNVALNYIINYPTLINASIISSPWIKLTKQPSSFLIFIARTLKKIFPELLQSNGLDTSFISRNKSEVQRYVDDKFIHNKISISTIVEMYDSGYWIIENAENLTTPSIFIHGGGDKITSPIATEEFVNKTKNTSTLKIFEGLFHETHNEIEREDVFKHLINELDKLKLYTNE